MNKQEMKNLSSQTLNPFSSLTRFEDLSNDILYEIFEYLDIYHIYKALFRLNQRYTNLVNHFNLPIKLNFCYIRKKSTFEDYYRHIILPHQHLIYSIYLTDRLIFTELPLSLFTQLQTLILENISSDQFEHLLPYLSNLSSLTIKLFDDVQDKNSLYTRILRLPALQYCKISFYEQFPGLPHLRLSNQEFYSIKYLVIDHCCYVNDLILLLSCLPELCRLSCANVTTLRRLERTNLPMIVLNHLTHLSLKMDRLLFIDLEVFFSKFIFNLQILHLSVNYDAPYLDAQRWQKLIQSKLSELRTFDLQVISKN